MLRDDSGVCEGVRESLGLAEKVSVKNLRGGVGNLMPLRANIQ